MNAAESGASGFSLLPVGSILPYAGEVPGNIEADGWLVCDGRALGRGDYRELFDAIGTAWGSPHESEFNVPAMAGMFLRGVAHGEDTDPSADARKAVQSGGASGDAVGSLQLYGTAQARTPFHASIPNYGVSKKGYDAGTAARPAAWNSDTTTVEVTGGDLESRPINKYTYYLIKCRERKANGQPVQIPVGSVIAFAGNSSSPDQAKWVPCDGRAVAPTGEWAALHKVIGFAHGETDEGEMVLPDYRGYFLRGVSGSSGKDPDAESRLVPYPQGSPDKQGNAGNKVGSLQGFATGAPTSSPFKVTFTSLPKDKTDKDGIDGLVRYLVRDYAARTVSLSQGGGDRETRPVNLSVNWYLRAR